jgi:hypothetical protein
MSTKPPDQLLRDIRIADRMYDLLQLIRDKGYAFTIYIGTTDRITSLRLDMAKGGHGDQITEYLGNQVAAMRLQAEVDLMAAAGSSAGAGPASTAGEVDPPQIASNGL